jgi:transcriptional regulator with XRE-family HTH domain
MTGGHVDPGEVERLYKEGMTTRQIAREIGVSPTSVGRHLKKRGVPMRRASRRPHIPSEAKRRALGAELRRLRTAAGLHLDDAARILECTPAKISRIETGGCDIRPKELRELLDGYGAGERECFGLANLNVITDEGYELLCEFGAEGVRTEYAVVYAEAGGPVAEGPFTERHVADGKARDKGGVVVERPVVTHPGVWMPSAPR